MENEENTADIIHYLSRPVDSGIYLPPIILVMTTTCRHLAKQKMEPLTCIGR